MEPPSLPGPGKDVTCHVVILLRNQPAEGYRSRWYPSKGTDIPKHTLTTMTAAASVGMQQLPPVCPVALLAIRISCQQSHPAVLIVSWYCTLGSGRLIRTTVDTTCVLNGKYV